MGLSVIFLDIDGVLNSRRYMNELVASGNTIRSTRLDDCIDPAAVNRLNLITKETGACIVVSSSWRIPFENDFDSLVALLRSYGILGDIIGATACNWKPRGVQIQMWIDEQNEFAEKNGRYHRVEKFVIVDDDNDMYDLNHRLVKTKFEDGLLDEHMVKMIEMLNN